MSRARSMGGLSPVDLTPEQIAAIYPLNQLEEGNRQRLQSTMRLLRLRAGRTLFSQGEAPGEIFWVLDGVVQLADARQERLETVSPAHESIAMPLPYMVPANESARCLVDCEILCADRTAMNELLSSQDIEIPRTMELSSEELFREFETLRKRIRSRAGESESEDADGREARAGAAATRSSGSKPEAEWMLGGRGASPKIQPAVRGAAPNANPARRSAGEAVAKTRDLSVEAVREGFAAFDQLPGYHRLDSALRARCLYQCREVSHPAGTRVLRQGDRSDAFYLIVEGQCEVVFSDGVRQLVVNRYGPGASFGEDGLITREPRNASVIADTDLRLLRMDAEPFRRLLLPAMAQSITAEQLEEARVAQAIWIDVRLPREREGNMITGALEIPWPVIRSHPFTGDPGQTCIIVCANGRRAPVVSFALRKFGFDAYHLQGGFQNVPRERIVSRPVIERATPRGIVRIA